MDLIVLELLSVAKQTSMVDVLKDMMEPVSNQLNLLDLLTHLNAMPTLHAAKLIMPLMLPAKLPAQVALPMEQPDVLHWLLAQPMLKLVVLLIALVQSQAQG
jgi:hypothetical protein